ncbi:hypothetical protein ACINWC323_3759 [Acinetobacter sp. WC-323]|nr:hypothetical protein ACINWC323_3759 [Acinetobacter sp. WC-323]
MPNVAAIIVNKNVRLNILLNPKSNTFPARGLYKQFNNR